MRSRRPTGNGPASGEQSINGCDGVLNARIGVNQGLTAAPGSFEPLPNNPRCAYGARGADQAWLFTSPVDATYAVSVTGSFADVALHFRSECGNPQSEIGCRDDIPFPLGEDVYGLVVMGANRSVYIIVDTVNTHSDSYLMRIERIE